MPERKFLSSSDPLIFDFVSCDKYPHCNWGYLSGEDRLQHPTFNSIQFKGELNRGSDNSWSPDSIKNSVWAKIIQSLRIRITKRNILNTKLSSLAHNYSNSSQTNPQLDYSLRYLTEFGTLPCETLTSGSCVSSRRAL